MYVSIIKVAQLILVQEMEKNDGNSLYDTFVELSWAMGSLMPSLQNPFIILGWSHIRYKNSI